MFLTQRGKTTPPRLNAERLRREAAGEQRFVEVAGRRLCYWEKGEGQPVILLHGLGGSAFDWRHNIDAIAAAGHRVLAFDFLGAGLTDKPAKADYSLRAQAELIEAALGALDVGPGVFVGNSFGGGVCLVIAQLFPERVEGLFLIDSVCYRQQLPDFVHLFRLPILPSLLSRLIPTRPITQAVLWHVFGNAHAVEEDLVRDYTLEVDIPGRKLGLIYTARDVIPADPERFEEGIRKIRTPVQILWGALDTIIPVKYAFRLQADLAGSQLAVLDKLGHVPHQEAPEEVNRRMLDFLTTRCARAGGRRRRAAAAHPRA